MNGKGGRNTAFLVMIGLIRVIMGTTTSGKTKRLAKRVIRSDRQTDGQQSHFENLTTIAPSCDAQDDVSSGSMSAPTIYKPVPRFVDRERSIMIGKV